MVRAKLKQLRAFRPNKWNESYYVEAYRAALDGLDDKNLAERLGIDIQTLKSWCVKFPALQEAIDKGRERSDHTFAEYVFRHLPPDLKRLYTEIESLAQQGDPLDRIVGLLSEQGDHVKQNLFLYALVESDFDASTALSRLRIPKSTLDRWVRADPKFGQLCEEVIWHKRNYLEGALFKLIARGDRNAVIFANKTLNADRGYGNKVKVEHSGSVTHSGSIGIRDLALSLEDKKKILKAVRTKQEQIEDADYEEQK